MAPESNVPAKPFEPAVLDKQEVEPTEVAKALINATLVSMGENKDAWRSEVVIEAIVQIQQKEPLEANRLMSAIGRAGGNVKGDLSAAVRSHWTKLKLKEQKKRLEATDGLFAPWHSGYVWVSGRGEFFCKRSTLFLAPKTLDITHMKDVEHWVDEEGRQTTATALLQLQAQIPVADQVMYNPDAPQGVFSHSSTTFWNTFNPNTIPKGKPPEQWDENERHAIKLWHEHIVMIAGDSAIHLIQWLAHNRQHPGRKITYSPLISGPPGVGKSVIGDMMAATLGAANVKVINSKALTTDFNDYAWGSALALVPEVYLEGNNRYGIWNAIKPLITDPVIGIHPKGKPAYDVVNTQNYFLTTNHLDSLPLTRDDRRILVIRANAPESAIGKSDYFRNLFYAMRFVEALAGWLDSIDLSSFDAKGDAPWTEAKAEMVLDSRSTEENWLHSVIENAPVISITAIGEAYQQKFYRALPRAVMNRVKSDLQYETWTGPNPNARGAFKVNNETHTIWVKARSGYKMAENDGIRQLLMGSPLFPDWQ